MRGRTITRNRGRRRSANQIKQPSYTVDFRAYGIFLQVAKSLFPLFEPAMKPI
jgi:hypothetical protein